RLATRSTARKSASAIPRSAPRSTGSSSARSSPSGHEKGAPPLGGAPAYQNGALLAHARCFRLRFRGWRVAAAAAPDALAERVDASTQRVHRDLARATKELRGLAQRVRAVAPHPADALLAAATAGQTAAARRLGQRAP